MVERGGFEPPKAKPTDLQSAPFDRFGTSPAEISRAAPSRSTVFEMKFKSDETLPSRSLLRRSRRRRAVWPQPFGRPVVKAAAASQRLARWWLLFVPGVDPAGLRSPSARCAKLAGQ